jgi:hypothetical protein
MATWKWVLWDVDGTALGEVNNAYECKLSKHLNGMGTTSFRIRLDNPLAVEIMNRDGGVLCGVYRDSTLEFIGDLVTAEEVGPGYKLVLDRDGMLNRAYSLPADDAIMSEDRAAQTADGLFEGVVPSDLADPLLRKALLDAHIAVRTVPRRLVTIEPVTDDTNPSLACNFADPLWRLSKRLFATTASSTGTSIASTPRGDILEDMVTATNADRDTGIRIGSIATLFAATAGPWAFKPISEAFTEFAASYAPPTFESVTAPYQAQDGFSDPPGTSFLNGRTADGTGGTWDDSGYGATTGFIVDGNGDNLARTTVSDASGGRFAFLGPSLTNCVVQCWINRDGVMGAPMTTQGVVARGTDHNNHLVLYVLEDVFPGHQYFFLVKNIGGTRTPLWISNPGDIIYTGMGGGYLRLTVDDEGRWGAWWWPSADTSYQNRPIQIGQDADLATGGALASGKCGIHDGNGHASSANRVWEDFIVDVPAAGALDTQALDFELVPSVPTADTNQSGVVGAGLKIATLNISASLGSDKPHAVFNRGDGASVRNSAVYGTDYGVADTCRARLKAGGTTRLNATVRTYGIDIDKDENGKVTEKPMLVPE